MTTALTLPGDAATAKGATPLGMWRAAVRVGVRTIRRAPVLGLKRLILPVGYWRAVEFAYVCRALRCPPGARVLDLGSPKALAFMLAERGGYEVVATDILPGEVALGARYAAAQGLDGRGPGRVQCEVQDGRALSYPDASFDAVYSVSVLEHIPGDGDSVALRELVRVVRPGGVVAVTVPYDLRYRETFVPGPVYERRPVGSERVFFERHYDDATLAARLFGAVRASVEHVELWGERGAPIEWLLGHLGRLRLPLLPLEAFLAAANLTRLDGGGRRTPKAAFFTLRKGTQRTS